RPHPPIVVHGHPSTPGRAGPGRDLRHTRPVRWSLSPPAPRSDDRHMSRHLDVLVIESRPGAGATAVADLTAAGHRVVRCHDDGRPAFPCRGVERPGDCPVEEGAADVAVLARDATATDPTPYEAGLGCAVRAGVPVVATADVGSSEAYEPFLAGRADGDTPLVAAAEQAAATGFAPLEQAVTTMLGPLLADQGLDAAEVACRITPEGGTLQVLLELPLPAPVHKAVEQAVAVRALAALPGLRRPHDAISISVQGRPV